MWTDHDIKYHVTAQSSSGVDPIQLNTGTLGKLIEYHLSCIKSGTATETLTGNLAHLQNRS